MKFQKELIDLFFSLMEKSPDLDEIRSMIGPFVKTRKAFNVVALGVFENRKNTLAKKYNSISMCACDLHQVARITEALGFKLTEITKKKLMKDLEDCGSNDLAVLGIKTKKH